MNNQWLIYGAYGYTGKLISQLAVERGMQPILAGRDEQRTAELAASLGLPHRSFSLNDPDAVRAGINDCQLVLHCAGPFSATARPMIEACLDSETHYLDITGEIDVFATAHSFHEQARKKDIVVIPGTGFDVVPTDCLAANLVQELPAATHLTLAFEATGGQSVGTAKSGIEGMASGGRIRRDGELQQVPLAWKTMQIPFSQGQRLGVTIPWGDVFTAFISTGIPNIEVYLSVPPSAVKRLRKMRKFKWLLRFGLIQGILKRQVDKKVTGPGDALREKTEARIWGKAVSADGRSVSGQMDTPNGYDLTADAALGITKFLLENKPEGGFYTPSLLMGADYAVSLEGVTLQLGEVLSPVQSES